MDSCKKSSNIDGVHVMLQKEKIYAVNKICNDVLCILYKSILTTYMNIVKSSCHVMKFHFMACTCMPFMISSIQGMHMYIVYKTFQSMHMHAVYDLEHTQHAYAHHV